MKLFKFASLPILAAALFLFVFQNCSPVEMSGSASKNSAQESLIVGDGSIGDGIDRSGNGDVYGGKPYIRYLVNSLCGDNTKIASVIRHMPDDRFVMTRENCSDLQTAKSLERSRVELGESSIVYNGEMFIVPRKAELPPPVTYVCKGAAKAVEQGLSDFKLSNGGLADSAQAEMYVSVGPSPQNGDVAITQIAVSYFNGSTSVGKFSLSGLATVFRTAPDAPNFGITLGQEGQPSGYLRKAYLYEFKSQFADYLNVDNLGTSSIVINVSCENKSVF